MNELTQAVLQRARATVPVINAIAGTWVWPERTAAQFTLKINALEAAVTAEAGEGAEVNLERGTIDVMLDALHAKTHTFLTFAKTRHRHQPDKLRAYRLLQAESDSRAAKIKSAKLFEAAWSKVEPAWEPEPGETVVLFNEQIDTAEDELRDLAQEGTDETVARGGTDGLARELNDWNVAWYTDATAKFAEGTTFGDLIRSDIPTTYQPETQPPGTAGFTHIESSGPGEAAAGFAAPRGESYNIIAKGPGATDFTEVEHHKVDGEWSATGLAAGTWTLKGQGHNTLGDGGMSEEQTVEVA